MHSQFSINFTRYSSITGRENSASTHLGAATIDEALRIANAILSGMRDADPDHQYAISGVKCLGLHGVTHTGFLGIWTSPPSKSEADQ